MTPQGLSELAREYPITDAQKAEYREKGHILLRGVLTEAEIVAARDIFREVIARRFPHPKPLEERDVFHRAFLSLSNTWFDEPTTRPFLFGHRFAKICADFLEAEAVRVYHNQVFFKEPGGGPTPWHQDHYYWPVDAEMCTIWIPLVDITPEMGALRFATYSHRLPFLDEIGISDNAMAHFDAIIAERGLPVHTEPMQAGDATVHAGWTLHSAAGNSSHRTREVSAISYYPDGARLFPTEKMNSARWSDIKVCMPGVRPGEVGVSYMNPRLFQRSPF